MKSLHRHTRLGAFAFMLAFSLVTLPACMADSGRSSTDAAPSTVPHMSVTDAAELIERDSDVRVLDVRTFEEYVNGHIKNSMNIDYYGESFRASLDDLPRDKTYIVYCRCGKRGASSVAMMQELGFENAYNLDEGYLEWEFQRLPIER